MTTTSLLGGYARRAQVPGDILTYSFPPEPLYLSLSDILSGF